MTGLEDALFIDPITLLVFSAVVIGIVALFLVHDLTQKLSEVERIAFSKGMRRWHKLEAIKDVLR